MRREPHRLHSNLAGAAGAVRPGARPPDGKKGMMDSRPRRKIRVLLMAEACNPRWTSVPLLGYQNARALAGRPDVELTLVTQVRNRAALEADPIAARARISFVDNEFIGRPLYRLSRWLRRGSALSWTTNTALSWP